MKTTLKTVLTVCLISICSSVFAQDIIVLKNGDEVKALVQEVEIETIKYKKQENPTGPTYTIAKSEVFMIKYQNGEKDVFQPKPVASATQSATPQPNVANAGVKPFVPIVIDRNRWYYEGKKLRDYKELKPILSENQEALSKYNQGRGLAIAGNIVLANAFVVEVIGLGYLLAGVAAEWDSYASDVYPQIGGICILASLVPLTVAIGLGTSGMSKIKQAVDLYNVGDRTYSQSTRGYRIDFGVTSSGGLGLRMTF